MSETEAAKELMSVAERLVGTWVHGKYRLDRVLGAGGMAVVFKATHRNKKRVAVKMLRASVGASSDIQRRFLREGYVANTVDHPGAVSVLDDDVTDDGTAFLVMELLEGAGVDELAARGGGKLAVLATLNVAFQLTDTLAAAHAKGVVHRDIKPANLFVMRTGQVKVLDFGIARLRDQGSSGTTQAGSMFGTPAFMAPEQALGKVSDIDPRTDLWSVGATMFVLLSGRDLRPAETVQHAVVLAATTPAPSLATVAPDTPPSVVALVSHALAFDKTDRWETAGAMRDAIAAVYAELAGHPMRPDDLTELLPPPVADPDVSGSSIVPPLDPSDDGEKADALAETLPLGASAQTVASVASDLGASRQESKWRTVAEYAVAAVGVVALAGALALGLSRRTATPASSGAPAARSLAAPAAAARADADIPSPAPVVAASTAPSPAATMSAAREPPAPPRLAWPTPAPARRPRRAATAPASGPSAARPAPPAPSTPPSPSNPFDTQ